MVFVVRFISVNSFVIVVMIGWLGMVWKLNIVIGVDRGFLGVLSLICRDFD